MSTCYPCIEPNDLRLAEPQFVLSRSEDFKGWRICKFVPNFNFDLSGLDFQL